MAVSDEEFQEILLRTDKNCMQIILMASLFNSAFEKILQLIFETKLLIIHLFIKYITFRK